MSFPGDPNGPPNPYQAPVADLAPMFEVPPGPPEQLARAPKVFGVLSIVFASIILLFGLLGLLGGAAASVAGEAGELAAADDDDDGGAHEKIVAAKMMLTPMLNVYRGISYVSTILTVMSIALLVIGIGQVRYRRWAHRPSLYWSGLALACVGGMIAISVFIISPAYRDMFEAMARSTAKEGGAAIAGFGGGVMRMIGGSMAVMTIILYAPYPLLMLFFFSRDNVRASMSR